MSDSAGGQIMTQHPEQFERNHWAIHQAAPGTCAACDKVRAWRTPAGGA